MGVCEAGFLARFLDAWPRAAGAGGVDALLHLDRLFQASREGAELLAETRQMGWSMLSLARGLPIGAAGPDWVVVRPMLDCIAKQHTPSYLLVWSAFAVAGRLPALAAVTTWLWSWLENQVLVALKTVPLGQSAGQAMLFSLGARLAPLACAAVEAAGRAGAADPCCSQDPADVDDDGPGNFAPGFALACTQHESQYSRLFRS